MSGQIAESFGIMYGDQNFLLPSHMNYGRFFVQEILKYKDKIAMINGATDEKITFSEMAQQIVNTAASLTRLGVKRGDVVAICSENRIEYMTTTIAVMYAGAEVTFINQNYSRDELVHSINISKPRYIFLSPDAYKIHYTILKQLRIIRKFFVYGDKSPNKRIATFKSISTTFTDMNSFRPNFYAHSTRAVTALILYSSGTSGLPKGAKLTHLNLIVASQQPETCSRDIPVLTVAPWCNCYGQISTTDALTHGKTVIFLSKFEEKLYLQAIKKYKAGLLLTAPPLVKILGESTLLDNYDVNSVEMIHSGGASLDLDIIRQVKSRFPSLVHVLQGYGMTETSGAVTEELENVHKLGSVGKIIPGNIIKIVDIETRKVLGPNQSGEVCVKGLVLFEGYVGKPLELDEDGFYATGDIAYYDEEGYFYIVDRLKELIKYKAWQVAPSELEAVLLQHPAVKDVAVVGIPDRYAGEVPTAFIVKRAGANVSEKDLIDFVAAKVSPWKQIRGGVKLVEEIPKTGSGKILRRKLREAIAKIPSSKL